MMPKVGGRKFSYDAKGRAAAKREAKRTGKPMKMGKTGSKGGRGGKSR